MNEDLKVIITAQTNELKRGLADAKKEVSSFSNSADKSLNGLKSAFASLGKYIKVAAIGVALIKISKQAIQTASDLQEVQNVVDVSFGAASADIEKFSKQAIERFGLSELSAKQMASTFMSMSNGMGIASEDGKNMSMTLTGLAGDMASFYNVEQSVAQTALNSVFTGETESLKKFGIVLTDVNLQEYAYANGITKTVNSMSQAEKVALRYNYILKSTANVQGDFSRTSGSYANQIRILKEQWDSLLGQLGKVLLPILSSIISALNVVLKLFLSIGNAIAKVFGGSEINSAVDSTQSISNGMSTTADNTDKANKKAKELAKTLSSFDELNVISSGSDSSADSGSANNVSSPMDITPFELNEEQIDGNFDLISKKIESIRDLAVSIKDAFMKGFKIDDVVNSFNNLVGTVSTKIEEFKTGLDFSKYLPNLQLLAESFGGYISTIASGVLDLSATIFNSLYEAFAPALQTFINDTVPLCIEIYAGQLDILTALWQLIIDTLSEVQLSLQNLLNVFGDILVDLQNKLQEFWDKYGQPIKEKIVDAINNLKDNIKTFIETWVKPMFDFLAKKLKEVWDEHLSPLVSKLGDFFGKIITFILNLWNNYLSPIVDFLIKLFAPAFQAVFEFIAGIIGDTFGTTCDTFSALLDILSGVIDFISGIFTGNWEKAWNGIVNIFKGIINAIISLVNKAIDGLNLILAPIRLIVYGVGKVFGASWSMDDVKIPHIPKLATGGITTGSTIANIGEAGEEAVLPLQNHTEWMDLLADKISAKQSAPSKISLIVDGKELGYAAINGINDITKQTGRLKLVLV